MMGEMTSIFLIIALAIAVAIIVYFIWDKKNEGKKKEGQPSRNRHIGWSIGFIVMFYIALVTLITMGLLYFRAQEQFFFSMATAIIISWIIMLIGYYIWAIYFYNVNMGWDDDDWNKLDDRKKEEGLTGLVDDEPQENPHGHETLGLPPGTIRGTVAISLLVAGLAMVIASFQLDQTYDANSLFVDNFEFFKTAFLMMIAFYFGNKSLEAISNRNQGIYRPNQTSSVQSGNLSQKTQQSSVAANAPAPDPSLSRASALKNALKSETTPETTDTSSPTDFDDKESVG